MSGDLARRFEAVVFDWDRTLESNRSADAVHVRGLIEEASELGLELLALGRSSEVFSPGHDGPQPMLGGTAPTGEDCGHWIMRTLWERGIMPDRVVSVGVEPEGGLAQTARVVGGPEALATLLEDQIARRRRRELPTVDQDPLWTVAIEGDDPAARARPRIAVHARRRPARDARKRDRRSRGRRTHRADVAVCTPGRAPRHTCLPRRAGTRSQSPTTRPRRVRRVLELHTGVLYQRLASGEDRLDAVLFSSLARPATAVLRATRRHGLSAARTA